MSAALHDSVHCKWLLLLQSGEELLIKLGWVGVGKGGPFATVTMAMAMRGPMQQLLAASALQTPQSFAHCAVATRVHVGKVCLLFREKI